MLIIPLCIRPYAGRMKAWPFARVSPINSGVSTRREAGGDITYKVVRPHVRGHRINTRDRLKVCRMQLLLPLSLSTSLDTQFCFYCLNVLRKKKGRMAAIILKIEKSETLAI